jgi:carboxymethylenebutenolidase
MGETVEFASNGARASGYVAASSTGTGPGVVVVQEWWGIDPWLRSVADRLADAGFVALVPDLYHGEIAAHDEMDKASRLMNELPPDRAARDMSGAVDYLADRSDVTGRGIGVVGFCMGGMLAWLLAANRPDRVRAAVPFYGFPIGDMEPDWSQLSATVRGHMAERDDFFSPEAAHDLEQRLRALGKDVSLTVHPGSGHAFMAEHNALGNYDPQLAEQLWPQMIAFLHEQLDGR